MSEHTTDAPVSGYVGGTIIALLFVLGFSQLSEFSLTSAAAVVVAVLLVGWTVFAVTHFAGGDEN